MAAFKARSITRTHSRWKVRWARDISSLTVPHLEQVFVDGKNRSALTNFDPYQRVLYPSCRTNSDHEASATDLARRWFFTEPRAAKSSTNTTDLAFATIVLHLCSPS